MVLGRPPHLPLAVVRGAGSRVGSVPFFHRARLAGGSCSSRAARSWACSSSQVTAADHRCPDLLGLEVQRLAADLCEPPRAHQGDRRGSVRRIRRPGRETLRRAYRRGRSWHGRPVGNPNGSITEAARSSLLGPASVASMASVRAAGASGSRVRHVERAGLPDRLSIVTEATGSMQATEAEKATLPMDGFCGPGTTSDLQRPGRPHRAI